MSNVVELPETSTRKRTQEPIEQITVAPAPNVTIRLASACFGLSEKAIRRKIEEGKWLEGKQFHRAPDGGIFISIKGVQQWVEQGQA